MNVIESKFQFVRVTRSSLLDFISKARKRVVIAKPGYSCEEVTLIKNLSEFSAVNCTLYIDPSEEAVRWGFGDKDALSVIQQNLESLHVQTAKRIRLSVVVVDDSALIYVPVALSWEEEPKHIIYPNGFIGGTDIAVSFLEQISGSDAESQPDNKVIPFPGCDIPSKTIESIREELAKTQEKLVKNPALDPAKLRNITVYRNIYKLVKIEIRGARVKNKSVSLRPINTIFPAANERLKSSWQVFSKDDLEDLWQMQMFSGEIQKIIDEFSLDIKRFGYLIKVDEKAEFEKSLKSEKELLLNALTGKQEESKYTKPPENKKSESSDRSKCQRKLRTLDELLKESRKMLFKYFKDFVDGNDSAKQSLLDTNEAVKSMVKRNTIDRQKGVESILSELIGKKIRFPIAEDMIGSIDIVTDYYDVSDELLYENPEFKSYLEELSEARDDFSEDKIRKFSAAFKKAGV
jgi:hypothetical protein